MKEIFIAFTIALVAGSIYNSVSDSGSASASSGTTCGTDDDGGGGGLGAPYSNGNGGSSVASQQAAAGSTLVADVDEGSFQGMVLDSKEPVLVEFYTDNCPHCITMGPVLGRLAYNGQGVISICKINASKCSSLAERYNVRGVPAFILFNEGHQLDTTSGARTLEDMRAWLSQNNVSVPATIGSAPAKDIVR